MLFLELVMAAIPHTEGVYYSLCVNIYTFINTPLLTSSYVGSSNVALFFPRFFTVPGVYKLVTGAT